MCNLPVDPPAPKEIGNCVHCKSPLHRTDDKPEVWDYCCDSCGEFVCPDCTIKCSQCGQRACKHCMLHDLDNQEYFCDTAPMAVETIPDRLKQSECRAGWLLDGVAADIGNGD